VRQHDLQQHDWGLRRRIVATGASLNITNTGVTTLSGANAFGGTTTAGTLTMNAAAGTLILAGSNNSSISNTTLTTAPWCSTPAAAMAVSAAAC